MCKVLRLLIVLTIVLLPVTVRAQQTISFANLIPIKSTFCKASITTVVTIATACSGAAGLPANAMGAWMTIEGNNVRWTDDSTVPTSSSGSLLVAGGQSFWYQGDLTQIQLVSASGTAT